MNFHVPLILSVVLCTIYAHPPDPDTELFEAFLKKYSKSYSHNEYAYRFKNFKASLHRIRKETHTATALGDSVLYGITKYSDFSAVEFQKTVLNIKKPHRKPLSKKHIQKRSANFALPPKLPSFIDWRNNNAVTAVKNQENCGACWAFSTVETIESIRAIRTGILEELSVQQIIDCAANGRFGCNGGDTCVVLDWINRNNVGLTTEKQYPLTNVQAECQSPQTNTSLSPVVKLAKNFTCSQYVGNEESMIKLLALHGPIAAAVDASLWQDYLGGIIQYHCADQRNHAVEIVGYNFTGSVPYYIVRNSWGTNFGLNGYLHIAAGNNLCGIAGRVTTMDVSDVIDTKAVT